jgi:hypothetical protein
MRRRTMRRPGSSTTSFFLFTILFFEATLSIYLIQGSYGTLFSFALASMNFHQSSRVLDLLPGEISSRLGGF